MVEKTVFVTGASSGIGYSISIEFAKKGYKVFAGARRIDKLHELEKYGRRILELDVSSLKSVHVISLVQRQMDN